MSTPPIPDEQAALLAAIVAHPDDDAPRLVYADWLQEHGDEEQAQYIRDSIAFARFENHEGDEHQRMSERLEGVEARNGLRWLEALGFEYDFYVDRWTRGFPTWVSFWSYSTLEENGGRLLSLVPVRVLRIESERHLNWVDEEWKRDKEDEDAEPKPPWIDSDYETVEFLADLSDLTRLTALALNGFSDMSLRRLFESPYLSGLRYLDLLHCGQDSNAVGALAGNPSLAGLVDLNLRHNKIGVAGARAILESPHLRRSLKRLWLYGNFDGSEPGEREVLNALAAWLGDGLLLRYDEQPKDD